MHSAGPQHTAVAGVRPLCALTDDDEIDARHARKRAADTRIQPARPQIDVVVQREAQLQKQATFQHAAGHRRVADGAKQDGVVAAQLLDSGFGEQFAGRVIAPRTEVVCGLLDAGAYRVEHLERLPDHLGADAVTGNDR
jgi:hypothetical protein